MSSDRVERIIKDIRGLDLLQDEQRDSALALVEERLQLIFALQGAGPLPVIPQPGTGLKCPNCGHCIKVKFA
jgi:hypothetical protein